MLAVPPLDWAGVPYESSLDLDWGRSVVVVVAAAISAGQVVDAMEVVEVDKALGQGVEELLFVSPME